MNNEINHRLHKLSTTHLCDALSNIRVLDSTIKSLYFSRKFSGKAFTVKCEGDLLPVIKALEFIEENRVLIINGGTSQNAVLGEIFTTVAKNKNVQSIIIDGYCRDISEIKNLGISLFARGICPKAGTKNKVGEVQTEITCGGVIVRPNDIVFGDENGVIVFSEEEADAIITKAEQIQCHEEKALEKIKNGHTLNDVLNFSQHYENISSGKADSQLSWRV